MLRVVMRQRGVGHGGFHTASLGFSDTDSIESNLTYVYDCGSKSGSIKARIDEYVEELVANGVTVVDWLILSHLDADHVSGVEYLSQRLQDERILVRKILIPMLSTEQQLISAAHASSKRPAEGFVIDLIVAPVRTLTGAFQASEVVELTPGSPDDDGPVSDDVPGPRSMRTIAGGGQDAVSLGLWECRAYANAGVIQVAVGFWDDVRTNVLNNPAAVLDEALIHDLVTNHREQLSKLTKEHLGRDGTNLSSIVLWSAPQDLVKVWCFVRRGNPAKYISYAYLPTGAREWAKCNSKRFGGWLSTGDAMLRSSMSVNAMMNAFGKSSKNRIMVVAGPHHGSNRNSNAYLYAQFTNPTLITAHAKRGSKHPGKAFSDAVLSVFHKREFVVEHEGDDILLYVEVLSTIRPSGLLH